MKKKILPVLVVTCLIIVIAIVGVISSMIEKYTPSDARMDGKEYFQLQSDEEAALIVNGTLAEEKVKLMDGRFYVDEDTVGKYISSRFYWDEKRERMLYTLPTEVIEIVPGTKSYTTSEGTTNTDYIILHTAEDTFFVDLEFVNEFSAMEYEVYEQPARVVVHTGTQEVLVVKAKKDASIREKGGIKSLIVDDVEKGEVLYLEEAMENWTRVSTEDGYTGYIENEYLSDSETVSLTIEKEFPEYTSIQKDYKINLAWHQVTSMNANNTLQSAIEGTQGLNTISPTWFSVIKNDGTISSLASATYVEQAHAAGLEVWGLIDNFSSNTDTLTFLSDTAARKHIIEQLIAEAKRVNMDGINLDFESITVSQAPHYVQFIRELSIACRLNQLVFSIDVPVPRGNSRYNFKEQGIMADYVIIMGYDEHTGRSEEAGSVASIGFVKEGITDMLKSVPAEKVINAIPFYTRVWIESFGGGISSEILGMDGAQNYIRQNGMDVYWHEGSGQNIATLEGDNAIYTIWVEDNLSIAEKMKLIKEYHLAGVASWKLGFQNNSVWEVIAEYLK